MSRTKRAASDHTPPVAGDPGGKCFRKHVVSTDEGSGFESRSALQFRSEHEPGRSTS